MRPDPCANSSTLPDPSRQTLAALLEEAAVNAPPRVGRWLERLVAGDQIEVPREDTAAISPAEAN